jgi:hypothetical protein
MKKLITKKQHGLIDYSYAVIVPMLPHIAGFKQQKNARETCYALGAGALMYSLLTKAPWGLFPVIPFKKHLKMDISASTLAIASPWLLNFSRKRAPRNTLIVVGILGLAASLLTDKRK